MGLGMKTSVWICHKLNNLTEDFIELPQTWRSVSRKLWIFGPRLEAGLCCSHCSQWVFRLWPRWEVELVYILCIPLPLEVALSNCERKVEFSFYMTCSTYGRRDQVRPWKSSGSKRNFVCISQCIIMLCIKKFQIF